MVSEKQLIDDLTNDCDTTTTLMVVNTSQINQTLCETTLTECNDSTLNCKSMPLVRRGLTSSFLLMLRRNK